MSGTNKVSKEKVKNLWTPTSKIIGANVDLKNSWEEQEKNALLTLFGQKECLRK